MTPEIINGTRVLFIRNSSKIVNIQILTDIGSSDEDMNEFGIAHFLEHMFFKGTEKRDAKQINRDADFLGAKLNAWTWHDQTNYHLSVMSEHFEEGFELLSDIYQNATFPEEEFEKERTVILSEIRRYEDDPPSALSDQSMDYFCTNGLAHKVTGTEQSVNGISRDALIAFKKRYYGGENVLISIVGDIPYEEVKKVISRYFINLSCSKPLMLKPGQYRAGTFNMQKSDIQEAQYQLLFPALPFLDDNAVAQGVMNHMLGGNASALLFERIREELGLCYGIYSRIGRFEGFNVLEISTGCSPRDIDYLHEEVLKVIEKFQRGEINANRLKMVKASMLSSLYMGIESSSGLNSFISLNWMRGDRDGQDMIKKRAEEIKKVSLEDIITMADYTFKAGSLKAVLMPS